MPVGAIVGAGALTAGATVVAGSKNSKAISKASDAQAESNAQSVALQREIYGQNKPMLTPFIERGNVAGNALQGMLGLNTPAQQPMAQPQPNALAQFVGQNGMDISPDLPGVQTANGVPGQFVMPGVVSGYGGGTWNADGSPATPTPSGAMNPLPGHAADPFKRYIENSDYAFQRDEGINALNSGWAGAGLLQSGAALKDSIRFGKNLDAGYRTEYMGMLGNQQGVGLTGASALAGVGQGFANSITAANQNNANAIGQMAVARANNSNAMIAGITGAMNNTVGTLHGMGKL